MDAIETAIINHAPQDPVLDRCFVAIDDEPIENPCSEYTENGIKIKVYATKYAEGAV